MKSYTKGTFSSALKTVRSNRARSLTTMLGIIIGVVAAIVVVGIGEGARVQVRDQISRLGKDLIVIRPGDSTATSGILGSVGLLKSQEVGSSLSPNDVVAAGQADGVRAVVPLSVVDGTVAVSQGNGKFNGNVVGTDSKFADVIHQPIAFGGFISGDNSDGDMAVIGPDVATNVFGESVPLGRTLSFRGHEFIVTGIFKPFETAPFSSRVDFNNAIFIPYATAQELSKGGANIYEILVQPSDINRADTTIASLNSKLTSSHGGDHNFAVQKQGQSLGVTNDILSLLSALVLVAAAMSLIVGGVSIMNIMLVSIAERLHEIGIRKAVGATDRQILYQFMSEALILSLAGWLIGVVTSVALIYLIKLFSTIEPVVSWPMVGITFVGTLIVGTLFGSIPAISAARKDPIAALRSE